MDEDEHSMEVIVPDDQLSLAIGKKGQNVTLASRLSGWRLDVRGESEADEEVRQARASLSSIAGVSDVTAELLLQHGFRSAEEVAESDVEGIAEVEGIDPDRAVGILEAARLHVAERRAAAAGGGSEAAGGEVAPEATAESPAPTTSPSPVVRAAEPAPERKAPVVPSGPFEDPAQFDAFEGFLDEESKA